MPTYSLEGPTIPAGQSISESIDCSASRIVRIVCPDAWDSAPLSFDLSLDGVTFHPLHHIQIITGGFQPFLVTVPIMEPNAIYAMPADTGELIGFVRFRSGTKAHPVVQSADRRFQLVLA